ncbi:DUF2752 domain-containing protein [Flavobacterium wongokense]|uniref:DUF2752 domain-containing protein n=1 Tax=Flavobacterium wongokense TaxID=2910674 RepID=UPI001F34BF7E|nr:DUF2752 domain-containing protein [Flavobacterium sp. WG47]MCF6131666.1 DUF2752 domain-containing protein [Flavobacterium sp. WG47]
MTRNKLYSLLLIACFAGFIYLFYHIQTVTADNFRACIIKSVTGYPCPSCGTTRAVSLLLHGKIIDSIVLNPFGIIVAMMMAVFPIWVVIDIVLKKDTFFRAYEKAEATIRKPWLATILIALVLLNWIWNIYKHL